MVQVEIFVYISIFGNNRTKFYFLNLLNSYKCIYIYICTDSLKWIQIVSTCQLFFSLIHMFEHVQCMYHTLNTCTLNKCDLTAKFRQVHLNIPKTYLYLQYM